LRTFLQREALSIFLAVFLAVVVTWLIVYAPCFRLGEEAQPEPQSER